MKQFGLLLLFAVRNHLSFSQWRWIQANKKLSLKNLFTDSTHKADDYTKSDRVDDQVLDQVKAENEFDKMKNVQEAVHDHFECRKTDERRSEQEGEDRNLN